MQSLESLWEAKKAVLTVNVCDVVMTHYSSHIYCANFACFFAKNKIILVTNMFYIYTEIQMQSRRKQLRKLREKNADQGYVNLSRTFRAF